MDTRLFLVALLALALSCYSMGAWLTRSRKSSTLADLKVFTQWEDANERIAMNLAEVVERALEDRLTPPVLVPQGRLVGLWDKTEQRIELRNLGGRPAFDICATVLSADGQRQLSHLGYAALAPGEKEKLAFAEELETWALPTDYYCDDVKWGCREGAVLRLVCSYEDERGSRYGAVYDLLATGGWARVEHLDVHYDTFERVDTLRVVTLMERHEAREEAAQMEAAEVAPDSAENASEAESEGVGAEAI